MLLQGTKRNKYIRDFMKRALITGITGQDGSYLAELLLEKKYKVFGLVRHSSNPNYSRIQHILDKIELIKGDLTDYKSLCSALTQAEPDEIYNLASQSFVPESWNQPTLTLDVNAGGVLNLLEAIKNTCPKAKFLQASTSEMYGGSTPPQNETTPFYPKSPYGIAKLTAHWLTINYRESYGMYCCSAISFNHESPRRQDHFVTRKVTLAVARIKLEKQNILYLGNLDAKRDWSHAKDVVHSMWTMLQRDKPKDYVLGSGTQHSIREMCKIAFEELDLNYKEYVKIDPKYYRPVEVQTLLADSTEAIKDGIWKPTYTFKELIKEMVKNDYKEQSNN